MQFANREACVFQLRLRQPREEIRLILARVECAHQLDPVALVQPRVVAGCQRARPRGHREIQKRLELDFAVAEHVRIRRPPAGIFLQKIGKYAVAILPRKVHRIVGNSDHAANVLDILIIARRGADAGFFVLFFPVFHEHADDVLALLLEQVGRHGAVHATGHANNHMPGMQFTHPLVCLVSNDGAVRLVLFTRRLPS
ncbi:hypothetical protein SDC9_128802 [bioreactor metagenome]|uniref:Uncharacterized protein n=1 Tax=bioreactor metagenome TaxID=1076179 RepID=A0A645CY20_9ZZZZ